MSGQMSTYIATGVLYALLYVIGGWGLNLQFATAGIINFGFILFEAIGGYVVGLFTLGPAGPRPVSSTPSSPRLALPAPDHSCRRRRSCHGGDHRGSRAAESAP